MTDGRNKYVSDNVVSGSACKKRWVQNNNIPLGVDNIRVGSRYCLTQTKYSSDGIYYNNPPLVLF